MKKALRIAILGWGSLVWNPRNLRVASGWRQGGPVLPIEFSRVSADGRLTLVIEPGHGVSVPVRYADSARAQLEDAISDLCQREKTAVEHIGFVDLIRGPSWGRHAQTLDTVRTWASCKDSRFPTAASRRGG